MVEFKLGLGLRLHGSQLVFVVVDNLGQLDNPVGVRFPGFEGAVISRNISDAFILEQLIAVLHAPHDFLEGDAGLLGIGNDMRQLVRQALV